METYKDGRLLFLTDAEFDDFWTEAEVPVIDGWNWKVSGDGTGYLQDPEGQKHCQFNLIDGTMKFEPDGMTISAPGLDLSLAQEMGETYATEVAFTEAEQAAYQEHVLLRDNTKKQHDQQVRGELKGTIQLEHRDGSWLAHVDNEKVKDLTGIDAPHVCSAKDGVELFNRMSEKLHAKPLKDPTGYMALKGNIYDYLHQEYRNQYEDTLQAIDNQLLDGTGYAVSHVLDTMQSVVRKDIKPFLPEGETYGNLRFVEATDERKKAVRDFVRCRVDKTLTFEKKRSYEKATLERTHQKFLDAGERFKESLADVTGAVQDRGEQMEQ